MFLKFLKKNWPVLFIGFFLLLSFLLPLFFLWKKEGKPKKPKIYVITPAPEAFPINVTISNVFPHGFTISWVSVKPGTETNTKIPEATTGKVIFSQNQEIAGEGNGTSVFDQRGESFTGTTHFVEVSNLQPEATYYFKIKSGPSIYSFKRDLSSWLKNGSPQETAPVRTPKIIGNQNQPPSPQNPYGAYSLEAGAFLPCSDGSNNPASTPCFRPNPLLITSGGKSGVIFYLAITRQQTIISSMISCLTGTTGNCLLDLANLYDKDFNSYLPYNPATDKINIWANGGDKGNLPPTEKPVPEVIADACLADPLHCQTAPAGEKILNLNLGGITPTPTSGAGPTPTPTSGVAPTPTPSPLPTGGPTPTIPANTPVIKLKVNFSGVTSQPTDPVNLDYQNQKIKIFIKRAEESGFAYGNENVIVKATTDGNQFDYETDNNHLIVTSIEAGTYDIFIKGPKHLKRKFANQNLTNGLVTLDFSSSDNYLLGGDLPLPQDGDFNNLAQNRRVNSQDYTLIVNNFNSTETQILNVADLNLDGIINGGDTSVLAITLAEKSDDE